MAIKKKVFDLGTVNASGDSLTNELRINDSTAKHIVGFAFQSDRVDMLATRGETEFSIAGRNLIPKGYPVREFLLGGQGVKPNDRLYSKFGNLEYGDGILNITYQDVNTTALAHAAYTVKLLIEYEI